MFYKNTVSTGDVMYYKKIKNVGKIFYHHNDSALLFKHCMVIEVTSQQCHDGTDLAVAAPMTEYITLHSGFVKKWIIRSISKMNDELTKKELFDLADECLNKK